MDERIPRGEWDEDYLFEDLVRQVLPLDLGGWGMDEVEHTTSALGWRLGPAEVALGAAEGVSRRLDCQNGPFERRGEVFAAAADPRQALSLTVDFFHADLPDGDHWIDADRIRAGWRVLEEILGPPTMWGGGHAWMLWRRPGTSVLLESRCSDMITLELLCTDRYNDPVRPTLAEGSWRAAYPADLPPAQTDGPAADWDDVGGQLAGALHCLNRDTLFFPGRFIIHLCSARDPLRFVQLWSDGLDLVIEATGYLHYPELDDPPRMTELGWERPSGVWQRRLPKAWEHYNNSYFAVGMLTRELQILGVDLADLTYDGTMSGRGHGFHLDLPGLGIRRTLPDDDD